MRALHTLGPLWVGQSRPILLFALVILSVVVGPAVATAQQLTLSWVDNSGGQAGFIIQRATGTGGPYTQIGQLPVGVVSYADTAVSFGTTYCYQVAAVNSDGFSAFSNVACGSPSGGFALTTAPGSVLPAGPVTFTWSAGSGVSEYWLSVATTPGGTDLYDQSQGTNLSGTVGGLPTAGQTLYVRLWSLIAGVWQFNDYTYTACCVGGPSSPLLHDFPGDYDGDGKTDIAVYRPSTGTWYVINSATFTGTAQQWGAPGDIPVPGDYDGDGKDDITAYRASNGMWFIIQSSNGAVRAQQWGASGDVPQPGDYDGDGKTDIAVYRPSTGVWSILNSSTGGVTAQQWGAPSDRPVHGDYDGDHRTDIAVYRPSTGVWFIINSSTGGGTAQQWGADGDIPVPGDYDGDGKTDIAVYRPSTGEWFIINSSTGAVRAQQWGAAGAVPVPGDYDGDGKTDIAVYRHSTGVWFIIQSSTGAVQQQQWGAGSDQPLPEWF